MSTKFAICELLVRLAFAVSSWGSTSEPPTTAKRHFSPLPTSLLKVS